MKVQKTVLLKNGKQATLRNAEGTDAAAFQAYFAQCHGETENLLTYPDESNGNFEAGLRRRAESASDVEILAIVDDKIVGNAGISMIRDRDKTRHRADFGISVLAAYWGLGIGSALTAACLDCARKAGYLQVELEAVSENESALNLYRKFGFVEYGRNPKGFRTRTGRWQTLVLMRLELI